MKMYVLVYAAGIEQIDWIRLDREVSQMAADGLAAAVALVLAVTPELVFTSAFVPAEYDVPLVKGAVTKVDYVMT